MMDKINLGHHISQQFNADLEDIRSRVLSMGGLVEQTGRTDEAIALLGIREARFRRPAEPGTRLRVLVEVVSRAPRSPGRDVCGMRWHAVDEADETLAEAFVEMLVRKA